MSTESLPSDSSTFRVVTQSPEIVATTFRRGAETVRAGPPTFQVWVATLRVVG
jgi:hypothetical protein